MKVLVCGGRNYNNQKEMMEVLQKMFDPDDTVTLIHGDAKGADRLSEQVLTGYFHGGFEVKKFPADWNTHGKKAGIIRNAQMLKEGQPELVVAFWDGKSIGTGNMIKQAEEAGIPVKVVEI